MGGKDEPLDCRVIAVLKEVCPKANCDCLVPLRTNVLMPGKETLESRGSRGRTEVMGMGKAEEREIKHIGSLGNRRELPGVQHHLLKKEKNGCYC